MAYENGNASSIQGIGVDNTPPTNGEALIFNSTSGEYEPGAAGGGGGDVTAASTITDNAIVRGDGGAKGIQQSGITISDNDLVKGGTYVASSTTSTDPATDAAVTTAIVDANDSVVITTTAAGNSQTIGDPTDTTAGKDFTVMNNDTSTDEIVVNSSTILPGFSADFAWDGSAWSRHADSAANSVIIQAKVNEVAGITKGQVVHISGVTGNFPQVSLADNTNFAEADVIAVANEAASDGQTIGVILMGQITGIDTSAFTADDILYLGTSGNLTKVHPTGINAVQRVGRAIKINASSGSMLVELDPLTDINDHDGIMRRQIVNQNAGTSASTAYTIVNDASHRASLSMVGSNYNLVAGIADSMVLYNEGYNKTVNAVDGNFGFEWWTDVTDSHNLSSTAKMSLTAEGFLGLGTTAPAETLDIVGSMFLDHTATVSDDHAVELCCNADGFGDVKALDILYKTGAIATGVDEEAILINIDETTSTGGNVTGLEVVTTTEGSTAVIGMRTGVGIDALSQFTGVFADADSILVNAVDQATALSSGGAGNISVFVADNDTITMGSSAKFEEIEFIVDTGASGSGITPTFEFSTGVGTWTAFSPADGTNAFKNTGVVIWDDASIPTWAVGTGSEYLIRITRTKNSLSTTPILDLIQIAAVDAHYWDKDGRLDFTDTTYKEQSAPTTPDTGKVVTYAKADGLMYSKDDAGVETLMSSAAQTSIVGITGTKAQFDTACTDGDFLYVGDAGDAETTITAVAQTTHGLVVGDVIKSNGTDGQYSKAQADSAANAEVVGIVTIVPDVNNFTYTTGGHITIAAAVPVATAGTTLFLSAATAGLATATEPTGTGEISKPVATVTTSNAEMLLLQERGIEIGASASSIITTKGDIIRGDNAGGAERFAVGANDEVLTADSTVAGGVKWAAPSGFTSGARVYLSSTQVIATGTDTKIQFDTETFDNDGEFDSTTNYRFTSTSGGTYQINGNARMGSTIATTSFVQLKIYKNGVEHSTMATFGTGGSNTGLNVSDTIKLAATDYIELFIIHGDGANRNLNGVSSLTFLSIAQIQ